MDDTPNTPHGRTALFGLIASHILMHACMTGLRMLLPVFALRQGDSAQAVGLLLAGFAFSPLLLAVPLGKLVDTLGLRRAWSIAVALGASAGVLCVWQPLWWGMIAAASLAGASAGLALLTVQRYVGQMPVTVDERKAFFGWISLAPPAANVLGPLTMGIVFDLAGALNDPTRAFRIACLMIVLFALASGWLIRFVPEHAQKAKASSDERLPIWALLRDPVIRRMLLLNWFVASCFDAHTFIVPLLGVGLGLSATAIGMILGANSLAAACMRPLLPHLTAGIATHKVVATAISIAAVLFLLFPHMPGGLSMALCSFLLGLSVSSLQPLLLHWLHQASPTAQQGQVFGLRLMTISASSVVMPMTFGFAGALLGLKGLLAGMSLLAVLMARQAWRERPSGGPSTGS